MTVLALAVLSSAVPTTAWAATINFRVSNDRGIPQPSGWMNERTGEFGQTDLFGNANGVTVESGDVLRFSRAVAAPSCGGGVVPEGSYFTAGITYTVPASRPAEAVVTLPRTTGDEYVNANSNANGNNDEERWLLGKINDFRAANGKVRLRFSKTLNSAASAVARDFTANGVPFPPPFCFMIPTDWGFPNLRTPVAIIDAAGSAYVQQAWEYWMSDASAPKRSVLLGRTPGGFELGFNAIGIGDGDGSGQYIVYLAVCPTGEASVRCEMTADEGDATVAVPSPPSGGGQPPPASGGQERPPAGGGDGLPPAAPGNAPRSGVAPEPAFSGLAVRATQKGFAVRGSIVIARGPSRFVAELFVARAAATARARGPLRVGKLTRTGVKGGKMTFSVPLNRVGTRTLRVRRTLKTTLRIVVLPPGDGPTTTRRQVRLRR